MTDEVIGTLEHPYQFAPENFLEDGLPYGAFCKCGLCDRIARSTVTFDYYANKDGEALRCETCTLGVPYEAVEPVIDYLESTEAFEERGGR